ncbi:MAG: BlaI/MecI/CopY family transcriptional regulator [Armatimonadetes bacterium]|nr:BlaI/MecI/CopY family transcriptional regulator [Armatimonadota bacterium]MBS1727147.1 BlaI/MecI/CopY family transcriptional regulator [Armatimonadota bacterium]
MAIKIGNLQLKIMRVLWEQGEATARQITDAINQEAKVAHSTIQTLLRKLEHKKAVAYEERDRTFYFRALVTEEEATQSATQDLLTRVFRGSLSGLVAHVLENEEVSADELDQIKRLIEEHEKK